MRPAVDALTHSDFLDFWSVIPSQARNTAHFVLTILELWGRLQRNLQNSPEPDSAFIVGRTPWSARDALVPLSGRRIKSFHKLGRPGGRPRTRAAAPLARESGANS